MQEHEPNCPAAKGGVLPLFLTSEKRNTQEVQEMYYIVAYSEYLDFIAKARKWGTKANTLIKRRHELVMDNRADYLAWQSQHPSEMRPITDYFPEIPLLLNTEETTPGSEHEMAHAVKELFLAQMAFTMVKIGGHPKNGFFLDISCGTEEEEDESEEEQPSEGNKEDSNQPTIPQEPGVYQKNAVQNVM